MATRAAPAMNQQLPEIKRENRVTALLVNWLKQQVREARQKHLFYLLLRGAVHWRDLLNISCTYIYIGL